MVIAALISGINQSVSNIFRVDCAAHVSRVALLPGRGERLGWLR